MIFYEILTYVRDWRFLPAARHPRVDDDYIPVGARGGENFV